MTPPTNWTPPPNQYQHTPLTVGIRAGHTIMYVHGATECYSSQVDSVILDEHIPKIARFLPRWEDVAGQLLVGDLGRLQTCDIDSGTSVTKNLKVLQGWKARYFHQATYRKLYDILCVLGETRSAHRVFCVMQGVLHLYISFYV